MEFNIFCVEYLIDFSSSKYHISILSAFHILILIIKMKIILLFLSRYTVWLDQFDEKKNFNFLLKYYVFVSIIINCIYLLLVVNILNHINLKVWSYHFFKFMFGFRQYTWKNSHSITFVFYVEILSILSKKRIQFLLYFIFWFHYWHEKIRFFLIFIYWFYQYKIKIISQIYQKY